TKTKQCFLTGAASESLWRPSLSVRDADEGIHSGSSDSVIRSAVASCSRYFWLAVLMLAPISKSFGEAESLFEGVLNPQGFVDPLTLEQRLLQLDDPFESLAIEVGDRRHLRFGNYGTDG